MSVTRIDEIWNGRKGQYNEYNERAYTRVFRISTDNTFDGPLTIMLASPVQVGDVYQDPNGVFDSTSLCRIVDPRQDQNDPQTWEVVCEFSNLANVLNRPAIFSWGAEHNSVAAETAYSAIIESSPSGTIILGGSDDNDDEIAPVLNVNGERFDPQPSEEETIQTLTITFNATTFNDVQAVGATNSINDRPFYGRPKFTGCLRSWTASQQEQGNVRYWQHTVVIAWTNPFSDIRPDWKQRVLNQGYKNLVMPAGAPNPILVEARDIHNNAYARPIPLDEVGFPLFQPGEKVDFTAKPPIYIAFRTKIALDWSQFGWPPLPS